MILGMGVTQFTFSQSCLGPGMSTMGHQTKVFKIGVVALIVDPVLQFSAQACWSLHYLSASRETEALQANGWSPTKYQRARQQE